MIERSIKTSYDCPVCSGARSLKFASGDEKVSWYICEICGSRLITMKNINQKKEALQMGNRKVIIDNPELAKILKKEYSQ